MLDLTAAFAAFPVLETERFLLRAVTSDDVADIFRIMSDPRVTRYFGTLPMAAPCTSHIIYHTNRKDVFALHVRR